MKAVIILALSTLAGCSSGPALEKLEADAMLSGDWSLVEKREAAMNRRRSSQGTECPRGYVRYCESRFMQQDCSCLTRESLGVALEMSY